MQKSAGIEVCFRASHVLPARTHSDTHKNSHIPLRAIFEFYLSLSHPPTHTHSHKDIPVDKCDPQEPCSAPQSRGVDTPPTAAPTRGGSRATYIPWTKAHVPEELERLEGMSMTTTTTTKQKEDDDEEENSPVNYSCELCTSSFVS